MLSEVKGRMDTCWSPPGLLHGECRPGSWLELEQVDAPKVFPQEQEVIVAYVGKPGDQREEETTKVSSEYLPKLAS